MAYKDDIGPICAIFVAFLELIIMLNMKAAELQQQDPVATDAIPWLDLELACSSLCVLLNLVPLMQSLTRAHRMVMWSSFINLVLSSATLYCSIVEFVRAFWKLNLTLPNEYLPVIIAYVVLIVRVVEKRHGVVAA